jgi:hypothetical protein
LHAISVAHTWGYGGMRFATWRAFRLLLDGWRWLDGHNCQQHHPLSYMDLPPRPRRSSVTPCRFCLSIAAIIAVLIIGTISWFIGVAASELISIVTHANLNAHHETAKNSLVDKRVMSRRALS